MASPAEENGLLQWSMLQQTGDVPSARSGHTVTALDDKFLLFGGIDKSQRMGPTNELYTLTARGDSAEWSTIDVRGEQPSPRWRHSAVSFSGKNLLIFGGFQDNKTRLNDVWVFDTDSLEWSQPVDDDHQSTPSDPLANFNGVDGIFAESTDSNVPCPRGGHSATMIEGNMFVFGGYGGHGHQRTDFNDLHCLHTDRMSWVRVDNTVGEPPRPRSGHTAAAVQNRILIFGGWNSLEQFNDLWSFDTGTLVWERVESATVSAPRWYHCSVSVAAVPHWHMFIFGGKGGLSDDDDTSSKLVQGTHRNDAFVLDTGAHAWRSINTDAEGRPPSARADAAMAYDSASQRLLIYGGWSNTWLGDIHALNVGCVIGPPYAVTSVEPTLGPVTGNTAVTIKGVGFGEGGSGATVRFSLGKKSTTAMGTVVDDSTISVNTPNVEAMGPGDVDVRVSMRSYPISITSTSFTFFDVTDPNTSLAYGPGLVSGVCAGHPTEFYIQARDRLCTNRATGGDVFTVTVRRLPQVDEDGKVVIEEKEIESHITDESNGRYFVKYTPDVPAKYEISVIFEGTFGAERGIVRGSTFAIDAEEGSAEGNVFAGPLILKHLRETISELKSFSQKTLEGLKRSVPAESRNILLDVKQHLHNVVDYKEKTQLAIDASECTIATIKELTGSKNSRDLDKQEKILSTSTSTWSEALKQGPVTKAAIQPLVKSHATKTKREIEKYQETTKEWVKDQNKRQFWKYESGYDAAMQDLDAADSDHHEQLREFKKMSHLAAMFEFPDAVDRAEAELKETDSERKQARNLWEISREVDEFIQTSKQLKWRDVNPEQLEESAKQFHKRMKKGPNKKVRTMGIFRGLDTTIKDFLFTVPLISALAHPSMRQRHWEMLKKTTGMEFTSPLDDADMSLDNLLSLNLHNFSADVEEITDQAMKEAKMEDTLTKLDEVWSTIEFEGEPFKEGSDILLLKISEENFELLENDQLTVQGMMASRFLATFEAEVTGWQRTLATVSEVLVMLTDIQRTWSYLEPLFIHSEEVKKELPEDAERFAGIDVNVKRILVKAWETKTLTKACNEDGLLADLENLAEELEKCKKSLADYLDGKRRQFPRFYFVSEADLLDILSNGNNPSKIVKHISKVFLATSSLELDESGSGRPKAVKVISGVGVEEVEFNPPVPLEGKVEIYLQTTLDAQKESLRKAFVGSIERYPTQKRTEWLMDKDDNERPTDPAAVTLLVSGCEYVKEVEAAFNELSSGDENALQTQLERTKAQLADLIRLTQQKLMKRDRQRVMCMITMDAHGRDVIEKMIREGVRDKKAFQWQSMLKQRFVNNTARIDILDASFDYGYEYLGNGARLVITPLTDRIYVTATQALNLKMGCAPAGPAGTGKTETTKDLASALGKCCYVFNCSPEMDYQSMGNIFKGLAASGSWGCFDEFNRLVPEVLSVCSVQFKAVCDSIRLKRTRVTIEGDDVHCDWTAGAFITMNPGYLGRSELPEGLKSLFRPITVMVPDLVLICENMLMAEGFVEAKTLASKFYSLYALLSELLSKQSHYDWGLRAVKSVLVVAGGFKRAEPDLPEQHLLMRALRDFNTPKIVAQDEVVFFGLLGDLFPGIDPPRKTDKNLEIAVKEAVIERHLYPDDFFMLKVVQLEELLAIRHCVFVMGPPASGKSQCWKTLATARGILGQKTKTVDINPKAVSPEELYGYITLATREWKDGLLSKIMRDLGNESNTLPKWIILDGDLDANWIESMNSVMDDNKMLTLASNERIPLKQHMRMLFEIRDLRFATPATVSRAGIIYISTNLGTQWRAVVKSWVQRLEFAPDYFRDFVVDLFEKYTPSTLFFLKKECKPLVPVEDVTMVTNLLRMMDSLLDEELMKSLKSKDQTEVKRMTETYFVFCAIWAFGSALSEKDGEDYRKRFSEFWKREFSSVRVPNRETVFDYWLDPKELKFDLWKQSPHFETIEYDSSTPMSSVTVPTPETCSVSYWMDNLVKKRDPVMLVGYAGCGKTQLVQGLLNKLNPEHCLSTIINFNFFTNSQALQVTLESPLEKKTGTNWGPPGKAGMIFFVDDLNLPEVDPYNTQSAIALLRQHIDYNHWYDRVKLQVRNVSDCQYVAGMNPTAGSFLVNPRLQRHFVTFAIGFPGPTSLHTIYSTFLEGHLKKFPAAVGELSGGLVKAALYLHSQVSQTFRKSAVNFHYEFNIRHLSNVFQGLLVASPNEFSEPLKVATLWLHESERVYADRLVSYADISKYKTIAQSTCKKFFAQFNMQSFFAAENPDPLVFCHFADSIQEKIYDRVTSLDKLQQTLNAALSEYNEVNTTMDLVLFEDAMMHVCRIARIINNPAGHALLVGVGGSGKQSLSRLASFICGYSVQQITISSTYGISDLKEDLKAMYKKAGLKEEGISFIFTDSQITNERFLVLINDLLASGNIPDLYATDEVDEIVNAITSRVKAEGIVPERKNCWNFFLGEVRKNLHVLLCFSPVGDDFRTRCTRFPALVNCTVIDWFQPWPKEALRSVGKKFLSQIELGDDEVRKGIEDFMPYSFEVVNDAAKTFFETDRRYVYTTPKSFLELLKLYQQLLHQKREESSASIDRLANGLQKLRDTAETVTVIEKELQVKLAEAEEKKQKSEAIAADVASNKAIVEEETEKANVEQAKCEKIQTEVTELAKNAEADLAKAEPAVRQAKAALDTLNKKDLGECKTMAKPPTGVDDVFAAVMVLLAGVDSNIPVAKNGRVKEKDRSWDSAKKAMLGNIGGFLENLMSFKETVDSYGVPDINWKEVRPYLALDHFKRDVIETKNKAAAGLCDWVINIVTYRDILVTVEPKRQALREANAKLEAANKQLQEVQEKVADLSAKLEKLTTEYEAANKEKQEAIETVERGQAKLDLANRLITALADENVRWADGIEKLSAEKELLVGDVLLASAFISYVGPFTKRYRLDLLNSKWVPFLEKAAAGERIPMSAEPNPMSILTNEAEIAQWNSDGLPDDRVSTENGSIVVNSARWPLMIDPQLQGIKWIREKEKDNGLVIVRLGQKDMLRKLERAIDNGIPTLIENMGERIDAVLNPVISRATMKKGHKLFLKLGDKEVELNKNFRLYMHTKLSNPHYPPEIQAETALVNFTVTEEGLEDQLLAMVVQKERPDLAEAKTALIKQQNQFKIKIKKLEDDILARLAAAEGDITEDVELIEGLEATKRIANDINEKVKVAKVTEALINETSEKYRSVAVRGSLLFFLMNELFRVHSYYIYSLATFVTVFLRAIDDVSGANNPMKEEMEAIEEGDGVEAGSAVPADEPTDGNEETLDTTEGDGEAAAEQQKGESVDTEANSEEDREEGEDNAGISLKSGLSDEQLVRRCNILCDSVTIVSFRYMNRGLFVRDKLTVATQLCFKTMVRDNLLDADQVKLLIMGSLSPDPGAMGPLEEWLPEQLWGRVKALESVKPELSKLGDDMQNDSELWQKWFDEEKPEQKPCPGSYKNLSEFHRILVLRALRPDRLTAALTTFVANNLGEEYVTVKPFDMEQTYKESSVTTPIFFVLFPGVDPTVWVEALGEQLGITGENGKFLNISMGQGQEKPAEAALQKFAETGGWLMLQNVHLMQSWLPILERQLELLAESAHPDFRCFISAEPPPMAHMKNMPESLMQSCIKVANEAPADLKSNLNRAWANFSQERIDECNKPRELKACLFTLCFYHAIVLGRRRFGQQGWSKVYSFNTGDLTVCANVLHDYINNNEAVPWEDLRYIFGEIMYGGHITDAWDRRTNNTYLSVYLRPEILSGMELAPGFNAPPVDTMSYDDIMKHINEALPKESPPMFGLHPNAEIGYLTTTADNLFKTILSLEGGGSGGGGGDASVVRETLEDLLERLPDDFVMIEIEERAKPLLQEKTAPYVLVAMQECTRMNRLLGEIRRTLIALRKGLKGELNMSEAMEDLAQALSINQVPGRNPFHKTSWEALAWSSKKSLQSWFSDLLARVEQLERWSADLVLPLSLWLPGLFNPMAFLTAIKQIVARQTGAPLDNMEIETHITTLLKPEEATEYPLAGAYAHGLFIEGARWALGEEAGEPTMDGNTPVAGFLTESRLKELLPPLPLVYFKAVQVQPEWEPSSVGYLRHNPTIYECPVYTTTFRGPTYVVLATLNTRNPVDKWIRAGVAIIMQTDE